MGSETNVQKLMLRGPKPGGFNCLQSLWPNTGTGVFSTAVDDGVRRKKLKLVMVKRELQINHQLVVV